MNQKHISEQVIKYYSQYYHREPLPIKQQIKDTIFELDPDYQLINIIGQGSYGIVAGCKCKTVNAQHQLVAIKKIIKAFDHKLYAKRTLRELRLLRLLQHDNIMGIQTILLPKSRESFEDIYVVQELMETDLSAILRQQQLTEEHHQFFLYQILRGLKYIHSAKVVHRDLKPKNLLVNRNCDLKICDFGLARAFLPELKEKAVVCTPYVQTRWYRAPELFLSWQEYDFKVDLWSVGCIFAEMLRRRPFLPGTDTRNQIELIFDVLGTPSQQECELIPQEERELVKSLPCKPGRDFHKLFPTASNEAIDLLKKLLCFQASKRISVEEALSHPYLSAQHWPEDEPIAVPVQYNEFRFEEYNMTVEQWKDCIYEEILLYHFNDFKQEYEKRNHKNESNIEHIINNENSKIIDTVADADFDDSIDEKDQYQQK